MAELLHTYSTARHLGSNLSNLLSVPCTELKAHGNRAFEAIALPARFWFADLWIFFNRLPKTHRCLDRHSVNCYAHGVHFICVQQMFVCISLFFLLLLSCMGQEVDQGWLRVRAKNNSNGTSCMRSRTSTQKALIYLS